MDRGYRLGRNHFGVTFKREATWCDIRAAVASVGGLLVQYIQGLGGLAWVEIPCVDFDGLKAAMETMRVHPNVDNVTFNVRFRPEPTRRPRAGRLVRSPGRTGRS